MDTAPLKALASDLGIEDRVRWIERFVIDREIAAYFERADIVALPYRQIDQSGVLFTALAFAKPMLVARVGGFSEIADRGAARGVEPDDLTAIARGLTELLANPTERDRLTATARDLASGEFSWDAIATRTLALYAQLQ